uniref:KH domain-containing protein, putative n=1 Tax=Neospora caninum (strain Liverpool) TaxID=572307 RepID=A0A0F7UMK3_NEOCL|nr:TPA: KH domain-containing protein, putative [Neospora caninum Liverpool]
MLNRDSQRRLGFHRLADVTTEGDFQQRLRVGGGRGGPQTTHARFETGTSEMSLFINSPDFRDNASLGAGMPPEERQTYATVRMPSDACRPRRITESRQPTDSAEQRWGHPLHRTPLMSASPPAGSGTPFGNRGPHTGGVHGEETAGMDRQITRFSPQTTAVRQKIEIVFPGHEHRCRRYLGFLLDIRAATNEVFVQFSGAVCPPWSSRKEGTPALAFPSRPSGRAELGALSAPAGSIAELLEMRLSSGSSLLDETGGDNHLLTSVSHSVPGCTPVGIEGNGASALHASSQQPRVFVSTWLSSLYVSLAGPRLHADPEEGTRRSPEAAAVSKETGHTGFSGETDILCRDSARSRERSYTREEQRWKAGDYAEVFRPSTSSTPAHYALARILSSPPSPQSSRAPASLASAVQLDERQSESAHAPGPPSSHHFRVRLLSSPSVDITVLGSSLRDPRRNRFSGEPELALAASGSSSFSPVSADSACLRFVQNGLPKAFAQTPGPLPHELPLSVFLPAMCREAVPVSVEAARWLLAGGSLAGAEHAQGEQVEGDAEEEAAGRFLQALQRRKPQPPDRPLEFSALSRSTAEGEDASGPGARSDRREGLSGVIALTVMDGGPTQDDGGESQAAAHAPDRSPEAKKRESPDFHTDGSDIVTACWSDEDRQTIPSFSPSYAPFPGVLSSPFSLDPASPSSSTAAASAGSGCAAFPRLPSSLDHLHPARASALSSGFHGSAASAVSPQAAARAHGRGASRQEDDVAPAISVERKEGSARGVTGKAPEPHEVEFRRGVDTSGEEVTEPHERQTCGAQPGGPEDEEGELELRASCRGRHLRLGEEGNPFQLTAMNAVTGCSQSEGSPGVSVSSVAAIDGLRSGERLPGLPPEARNDAPALRVEASLRRHEALDGAAGSDANCRLFSEWGDESSLAASCFSSFFARLVTKSPATTVTAGVEGIQHGPKETDERQGCQIVLLGFDKAEVERLKAILRGVNRRIAKSVLFHERRERRLRFLEERTSAGVASVCVEFKAKETIGLIIGKQGERLEKLAKRFQVEIRVFPQEEDAATRRVRIYGSSRQAVEEALAEVQFLSASYRLYPASFARRLHAESKVQPDREKTSWHSASPPSGPRAAPRLSPWLSPVPVCLSDGGNQSRDSGKDSQVPELAEAVCPVFNAPVGSRWPAILASRPGMDRLLCARVETEQETPRDDAEACLVESHVATLKRELRRKPLLRQIGAATGLLEAWFDEATSTVILCGLWRHILSAVNLLDALATRLLHRSPGVHAFASMPSLCLESSPPLDAAPSLPSPVASSGSVHLKPFPAAPGRSPACFFSAHPNPALPSPAFAASDASDGSPGTAGARRGLATLPSLLSSRSTCSSPSQAGQTLRHTETGDEGGALPLAALLQRHFPVADADFFSPARSSPSLCSRGGHASPPPNAFPSFRGSLKGEVYRAGDGYASPLASLSLPSLAFLPATLASSPL